MDYDIQLQREAFWMLVGFVFIEAVILYCYRLWLKQESQQTSVFLNRLLLADVVVHVLCYGAICAIVVIVAWFPDILFLQANDIEQIESYAAFWRLVALFFSIVVLVTASIAMCFFTNLIGNEKIEH